MSGQPGFGFAPVMGAPRRGPRVVRLARCGLFWMVADELGWFPLLPADGNNVDDARQAAARRYKSAVVRVVEASEVGR